MAQYPSQYCLLWRRA